MEWEIACRGAQLRQRFAWGDAERPDGAHRMNVWQGDFPERDEGLDGFAGLAPVQCSSL